MITREISFPIDHTKNADALSLPAWQVKYDLDGPAILLSGGLHGDEPTAMAALWRLIERLPTLALTGTVTIIPCANPAAAANSSRLIPLENTDLNRAFPGRADGCTAERVARQLADVLAHHDALVDVHTAGWSTPFLLVDNVADSCLARRIAQWASCSTLPVIREMAADNALLQGLDRSWSAFAASQGKLALTMELSGFHRIDTHSADIGADALARLIATVPTVEDQTAAGAMLPARIEVFAETRGFLEVESPPGSTVVAGQRLGVIRSETGKLRQVVIAPATGLLLAAQPISAVMTGSWVATVAEVPAVEGGDRACVTS